MGANPMPRETNPKTLAAAQRLLQIAHIPAKKTRFVSHRGQPSGTNMHSQNAAQPGSEPSQSTADKKKDTTYMHAAIIASLLAEVLMYPLYLPGPVEAAGKLGRFGPDRPWVSESL